MAEIGVRKPRSAVGSRTRGAGNIGRTPLRPPNSGRGFRSRTSGIDPTSDLRPIRSIRSIRPSDIGGRMSVRNRSSETASGGRSLAEHFRHGFGAAERPTRGHARPNSRGAYRSVGEPEIVVAEHRSSRARVKHGDLAHEGLNLGTPGRDGGQGRFGGGAAAGRGWGLRRAIVRLVDRCAGVGRGQIVRHRAPSGRAKTPLLHVRPWRGAKAIANGPSTEAYSEQTAREAGTDRHFRYGTAWCARRGRLFSTSTSRDAGVVAPLRAALVGGAADERRRSSRARAGANATTPLSCGRGSTSRSWDAVASGGHPPRPVRC